MPTHDFMSMKISNYHVKPLTLGWFVFSAIVPVPAYYTQQFIKCVFYLGYRYFSGEGDFTVSARNRESPFHYLILLPAMMCAPSLI